MSKVKRILAVVLAMAMVMAMSMVSFATEGGGTPVEPPKATATVKGVTENGAVVTAYQLVSYDAKGEYVVAEAAGTKGYAVGSSDATVVANIAKDTTVLEALQSTELKKSGNDYTEQLEAGTYLVLVTNAGSTIYNPMLVSLEVEYPNGVQPGEVDADGNYEVGDTVVYAKSTTNVVVHKDIVDEDGNVIGHNGVYDDVYAGDTVYFKITGTIPSYASSITNAKYTLTDEASEHVTLPSSVKTEIEGQLPKYTPAGSTDEKLAASVTVVGNRITIDYDTEYILAQASSEESRAVSIIYSATINEGVSTFDPATNTVSVKYRNNNGEEANGTPDTTYHFTFDLTGDDLVKVDDAENPTSLGGAEFELTDVTGNKTFQTTSIEEETGRGSIVFRDLKEGTYTLKETKAPNGYQISNKEYTVVIAAEYSEDGSTVTRYTVTITDQDTGDQIGEITHTADGSTGDPANIKNTALSALPSTGGAGIIVFTIVGCIIMIAAASMFFLSGRKKEE